MPAFGSNFDPGSVMMGRGSSPYLWTGGSKQPPKIGPVGPPVSKQMSDTPAPTSGGVLGPESIRATGTGPFDAAYRQNLATYAGGQFSRPGGNMMFNPTDPSTFPGMPVGGGNAPVTGMPQSLMDMALGGQGFSWSPPQPAATSQKPGKFGDMRDWMDQFMRNGRGFRFGSNA